MKNLGYVMLKAKGGSARQFQRLEDGVIATVHEPHGNDTIRQGTLAMYLRNMEVTKEKFEAALLSRAPLATSEASPEERYKHVNDTDGSFVSLCNKCCEPIARSMVEDDLLIAEASHPCY